MSQGGLWLPSNRVPFIDVRQGPGAEPFQPLGHRDHLRIERAFDTKVRQCDCVRKFYPASTRGMEAHEEV